MIGWRWRRVTVQTNRRCYGLTGKRLNQTARTFFFLFFVFISTTAASRHVEKAAHLTSGTSMPIRGSCVSGCGREQSGCIACALSRPRPWSRARRSAARLAERKQTWMKHTSSGERGAEHWCLSQSLSQRTQRAAVQRRQ